MKVMVVTGTDTGVGKTVVTAAYACAARAAGLRVAMVKPAQTGDDDDAAEVRRLAGIDAHTLAWFDPPMAPLAAADRMGVPAPRLDTTVAAIRALDAELVLVEGAGGLLVPFG